jgi:hypothetical protein
MWISILSVIAIATGSIIFCSSIVGLVTNCGSEE